MVVNYAAFVASQKPSNTFSLSVIMPKLCGALFIFVLGIKPPRNINHLFNSWSKQGGQNLRSLLLTGAAEVCWVIWLTRNDFMFSNGQTKSFLQVLFRGTHWLRFLALLQRTDDHKDLLILACHCLEIRAMELFASHGWPLRFRIGQ